MRVRFVLLLALVTLLPTKSFAQATTGSLSGTVTDESGAVLPGVTITVKKVDTGLLRSQVSDQRCEGVAATLVDQDDLGRERGAGGDRA